MKDNAILVVLAGLLLVSGCVSSKEYRARLADIDVLKSDVGSLQQAVKQKEAELAAANKQFEELKQQNQALEEDNKKLNNILKAKRDELNRTIAELRAKLANRTAEMLGWQNRVEELSREKRDVLAEKDKSIEELKKTYDSLVGEMQEEIKKGEITITQLREKLTVNMVEKILFDSGSAVIKGNGRKVLDRVAEILKKVTDRQIKVEGHTDNVPIGPAIIGRFPTNWELSTARATTVVRHLQERGLDSKLLSAEGYSEYRPVASNETEEGRARNRRIEIVLIPLDVAR